VADEVALEWRSKVRGTRKAMLKASRIWVISIVKYTGRMNRSRRKAWMPVAQGMIGDVADRKRPRHGGGEHAAAMGGDVTTADEIYPEPIRMVARPFSTGVDRRDLHDVSWRSIENEAVGDERPQGDGR